MISYGPNRVLLARGIEPHDTATRSDFIALIANEEIANALMDGVLAK